MFSLASVLYRTRRIFARCVSFVPPTSFVAPTVGQSFETTRLVPKFSNNLCPISFALSSHYLLTFILIFIFILYICAVKSLTVQNFVSGTREKRRGGGERERPAPPFIEYSSLKKKNFSLTLAPNTLSLTQATSRSYCSYSLLMCC